MNSLRQLLNAADLVDTDDTVFMSRPKHTKPGLLQRIEQRLQRVGWHVPESICFFRWPLRGVHNALCLRHLRHSVTRTAG